jgi:glucokinase
MIGVDFGATRIKIASVQGAELLETRNLPTLGGRAAGEIVRDIAEAILEIDPKPLSVGFAIPGEADEHGRVWRLPNVPGFEGFEIGRELSTAVGCPVRVENDGAAAAWAEARFGHGREYPSFLILALGTGVGGGLVLDGQVRRGAHGFAAEAGHVSVSNADDAWPCGCGARGCVEAYAGTAALIRRFEELGGHATEVLEIAESARRGEAAGLGAFEMMGTALGQGIRSMQNLLDLDAIVFSGGISKSFDLIEGRLRETLRAHAFAPPLGEVPLLVSEFDQLAGTVGAAHLGAAQSS